MIYTINDLEILCI